MAFFCMLQHWQRFELYAVSNLSFILFHLLIVRCVACCVGSLIEDRVPMGDGHGDVTAATESETSLLLSNTTASPADVASCCSVTVDGSSSLSYSAAVLPEYTDTLAAGCSAGAQNIETYRHPLTSAPVTDDTLQSSSVPGHDTRPFYQHNDHARSSPHEHNIITDLTSSSSGEPLPSTSRGFAYNADGLSGTYPLLPMRSDGPLQSLEGVAADSASYTVMSSGYIETPQSALIDSTSSYTMSLPPYPASEVDQSKLVSRIPSYLPYAATPRTIESSAIYGRSMPPVAPAFPSDAFTKDFFGQYLQETSSGPLHPLATHAAPLHDQHAAAAAGILTGYQQPSTLPTMPSTIPTMPHSGGGSELFRRAYSGVSDNLFGGMKPSAESTLEAAQSQRWMSPPADTPRRWNHTPPSVHPHMSRYTYPPGRTTELADTAKSLPPAPMSKRPDDISAMFVSTTSAPSSVHYPLSGSVYSPPAPGPPPYPHPALPSAVNSSHRQLEDAYRQMAAGDYRSLAQHRTASEMYGSALSSLDRYYYTARDAMYRSQQLAAVAMPHPQLAAAAMPHPFMSQTSQYPASAERGSGYVRESLPTYGQCPAPTYGFMYPSVTDKQYLPPTSAAMRSGDYLEGSGSQDSYSRHSVIYNMMPRYF